MNSTIDSGLSFNRSKVNRIIWPVFACALMIFYGCSKSGGDAEKKSANVSAQPASPASAAMDVSQIIERNRALTSSRDSTMKLLAAIQTSNGRPPDVQTPPEVQLTIYRKREPDARQLMLVEFTAPPQQRDLSALITISPQGEVEASRYAQSGDTFVGTKGVMSEDSLFGMTLQELADGQPEKYDFKLVGEEAVGSTPAYKLDGMLKPDAESRFNRLVMLISKENFAMYAAEFYDNHNELVRRLTVDNLSEIAGHPTRMRWTVDNLEKQKKVVFTTLDAKYDQNLSDSIFTREYLKKITLKQ
jgi:Outer membrane lipoprotein-sorting protein